jgi:hypothetical protein
MEFVIDFVQPEKRFVINHYHEIIYGKQKIYFGICRVFFNMTTNRISIKIGFWSAFLSAILFLIFTICFIIVFTTPPLQYWTNIADYAAYTNKVSQPFKYIAQAAMLLFAPLYVLLLNSFHDIAASDKKVLTRISLCFGIIFAILISSHYFIQLSSVRQNIFLGKLEGLEQFVQANPYSASSSINMLGWTLFFGLSSLFIAPIFANGKLEKFIKYIFILNGISVMIGGIGFIFNLTTLIFITINFFMGGAITVNAIALTVFFGRMRNQS